MYKKKADRDCVENNIKDIVDLVKLGLFYLSTRIMKRRVYSHSSLQRYTVGTQIQIHLQFPWPKISRAFFIRESLNFSSVFLRQQLREFLQNQDISCLAINLYNLLSYILDQVVILYGEIRF